MASTGNPVVDAILGGTTNQEVREAMLLGSNLESGWSETAVGDNGTSFGPFQMHIGGALTAAGGTPTQAENPTWAVSAMLPAYQAGVNSVSQALWNSNPELAAEEAAVAAERPAQSYLVARGQGTVNASWSATQNALKGIVSTGGAPSGSGSATSGGTQQATLLSDPFPGGALDPLNIPAEIGNAIGGAPGNIAGEFGTAIGSGITSAFSGIIQGFLKQLGITGGLKDFFIRFGLILLGTIILIVGLTHLVKGTSVSSSNTGESEIVEESPDETSSNGTTQPRTGTSRTNARVGNVRYTKTKKTSPVGRSRGRPNRFETGGSSTAKKVAKGAVELAAIS